LAKVKTLYLLIKVAKIAKRFDIPGTKKVKFNLLKKVLKTIDQLKKMTFDEQN
jgi:hypothetical protein